MKDVQGAKWLMTRHAVEIIDRVRTTSRGSGDLSNSRLSRLYRDVRAGQFCAAGLANEAFEYIRDGHPS